MIKQPPTLKPPASIHQVIYDALNVSSPSCAYAWNLVSPIYNEGDEVRAIRVANQFWRVQLSYLPGDTRRERMCLVDTMRPTDWQYDFIKYVVPTIVAGGLPSVIDLPPP